MAALQSIRKRSGLLIGILGLALLAFILGDLFNSGSSLFNKFRDKAFVVNGDVVSTKEYQDRITEMEEFYKMRMGISNLSEDQSTQLREQIYQQMVNEMIVSEQAQKLGLTVTDEELSDMIYGQNISPVLQQFFGDPQTGVVDRQAIAQYMNSLNTDPASLQDDEQRMQLASMQAMWKVIHGMIKTQRLEEKYTSLIAGAMLVNDVEAKSTFEATKKRADIAYVIQRYDAIPDSTVKVADTEIAALYKERKNNFKLQTELRKVSYFVKDLIPSADDYAVVEKEANTVREKLTASTNPEMVVADYSDTPYRDVFESVSSLAPNLKEFAQAASAGDILGPVRSDESYGVYRFIDRTNRADSVKLQMIFIPEGADKVVSNNFADSIFNVIKGGKDFAQVATELNQGNANAGQGMWVTEQLLAQSNMDKEFISSCFNAPKEDVFKKTSPGVIQIVRVEDKTAPVEKVKIAKVVLPVVVSDRTMNNLDNELNKFLTDNGDSKNFEKAAKEQGYTLESDVLISPSQYNIGNVSGSRSVIHWAFNEKVGSVKKFDFSEQRIVALIKTEIEDKYMPQSEVEDILKAEIIKNKKAEKMIADLSAKNLKTLDAYAQALNTKVDTTRFVTFGTANIMGLGREPIMNVYAEVGKLNTTTAPLKGENGVVILNVLNKADQEGMTYNPERIKMETQQRTNYYMSRYMLSSLRTKVKVEDNRVRFF